MTTLTDAPDFRATANTSDGLNCFWVIQYVCPPMSPEVSTKDFDLEVYALCDHQPTLAEAIKALPADEQDKAHTVRVKPMHQSHFGNAYYQGCMFINLHTGEVGPLDIKLHHFHTVAV